MPYPTKHTRNAGNYYSILKNMDDDFCTECKPPANDKDRLNNYGMLDSGTTKHFIAVNATVKNITPTSNQLNVKIPDGSIIRFTHIYDINWPELPKMRVAVISFQN